MGSWKLLLHEWFCLLWFILTPLDILFATLRFVPHSYYNICTCKLILVRIRYWRVLLDKIDNKIAKNKIICLSSQVAELNVPQKCSAPGSLLHWLTCIFFLLSSLLWTLERALGETIVFHVFVHLLAQGLEGWSFGGIFMLIRLRVSFNCWH